MKSEVLLERKINEKQQGKILEIKNYKSRNKKAYIESYGCQMNFSDSEIVASILNKSGFSTTKDLKEADLVFINTCSIREKAEQTARKRLSLFNSIKKNTNPSRTKKIHHLKTKI